MLTLVIYRGVFIGEFFCHFYPFIYCTRFLQHSEKLCTINGQVDGYPEHGSKNRD